MKGLLLFFKNLSLRSWIGILLLFVSAACIDWCNTCTHNDFARKAEKVLYAKEAEVKQSLNQYYAYIQEHHPSELFNENSFQHKGLFNSRGLVFLVYENDSLMYWSDNSAGVENYMKEVCLDNHFVKLKNGYYEVIQHPANKISRKQLFGLILIKNEYNYQNKYLTNEFFSDYGLPPGSGLSENVSESAVTIKDSNGNDLFDLSIPPQVYRNSALSYISIALYVTALIFLILLLQKEYLSFTSAYSKNSLLLFFLLSVVAIRAVMILNHYPEIVYETPLYKPSIFGDANSFWFGFMGDILINSLLFFYGAFVVQKYFTLKIASKKAIVFFSLSGSILIYVFGNTINSIINSLVNNSNISFTVTNLFSLNAFSFIGFGCVACLFFAYYILADKFTGLLFEIKEKTKLPALTFLLASVLHIVYNTKSGKSDLVQTAWPIAVLCIVYFLKYRKAQYTFSYGIIFIVIFSYITSHIFLINEDSKEIDTRKIYAEKLADQQDAVAENLFADISKKIKADTKLKTLLFQRPVASLEIEQHLRQLYFSGYWERFNVVLSVVDSLCVPMIKTNNPLYENNSYFDDQLVSNGGPTICADLFYIQNIRKRTRYIAKIPIHNNIKPWIKPAIVYVEIEPKISPDVAGYPELLLDKSVKTNHQLSDYSYAVYKNEQLIQRYGKYPFNFRYALTVPETEYTEVYENGFQHLVYRYDEQTIVVVSKDKQLFWDRFTGNSYFFMFFSLILLVFLYVREWNARRKLMNTSLNLRIQLLLVSVVLISLLGFGIGTFSFIKKQFDAKNTVALDEKIKSVLSELHRDLGEQEFLNGHYKEYTVYILKNLANVFSSDINMFDLNGNLYASSQPRLFEEGIISKKMNPDAFDNVISGSYINLVIKENIGNLNYYSAYQPFYNKDGKLLAYINLPYFARQNELEKEISIYVVALINIYVILFAFSTLAALFISNLVTRPLRMIEQRLSKIILGRRNEPIQWAEKDEIGSLVNEYNSMIAQLEESAQKLAKSERESAWREMAKQVAHEIKNPLTPMKLSIQHLQRTMETNEGDLKERIQKISAMLIEQIDTLSHIAGEFSAFAKMPKANLEKLNIADIVYSTVELFKETERVKLIFKNKLEQPVYISADKDQSARVFTNLIKNAIQAIPADREGEVMVSIYLNNKAVVVKVKDNGQGIAPEAIDKIFIPNFSTKTEGMGMGLAMVKNIVESVDGKIWFETTQHTGTAFYVSFNIV